MFYYKFNLYYDLIPWFGSKACKIKNLISPSFLRHAKSKRYPFWRIDTWFSKVKHHSVHVIEDGGWHFTNIKPPEKIFEKYSNFGHLFETGNGGWGTKKLTKVEYLGELNNGDWFKLTIKGGVGENDFSTTLVRVIKVIRKGNTFYVDNFMSLTQE
jgi:hypothetical protein